MSSKKISQNDPSVGVFSGDFTDGRFDSALALEEENPWEIVRSRRQAKTPDTARSAATLPVTGLQAKLQREREKAEKRARLIRGTKGEQGAQFLEQKTREFMKKSAVKTIAQEEKRIVTAAASRGIVFENAWAEGPPADVVSARAEAAAAVDDVVDLYDDRTTEQLVAEELGFSMEETSEEKQIRKERAIARALGAAKRDKALAQALDRERRKLNRISGQSRGIDPSIKARTMRRLTDQAAKVKKQLNDKTDYLAANLPAETLLQERSWSTASRSELRRMAAQATIFKSSWRQKKEPPSGGAALASWIKSDLPATRAGVVTRADHNMMMRGIKDKRTRGVLDYLFEKIEKDPKYGEADRATYFRLMDEAVLRLAPLGRVAHQGQAQSAPAPPRHTMKVHVQGLPVEVDIREALYSAVPQLEELARLAPTASRVVQGLISVAALAVAVGDASTWDGAIASCVLFAQANADIFSTLAHSLFDKIRAKLSGFRHQADDDVTPPDVIYEEIDKMLMKNTIVYSVWDLFSCLSISTITAHFGMKWLGWESSMNFFNFSRTFLKERVSTDTFFSKLLGFFKTLVDRISAAIKNGDWHELFKDARTPELFVSEALCILECEYLLLDLARPKSAELFKAMRRAGQLPGRFAHQLSVFEKRELCRELADEGTAHVKQLQSSPTPPISTIVSITRLIERLRSEVYNLDNIKLNGQLRREPFSLFIVGVPGCGKSRLTGPMSFALGHSMGLPTGPENRFSVVPNANFFDGYHNQWCLIMDDIDQSAAKPAYGDITHADIVREMINSKSTQLEQADVDAKGTKFANFMASFYMTNFEDGRVENFVVKAAVMAHWRRFHYYIKMEVNPKVRTEAGRLYTHMEGLAAKAKEANITEDEYWTFIVHDHDDSKFSPTNAYTTRPFKEYKRFTTRSSFLTWLTKVFQEHHEQQDRELSAVDESDVCIHCHLPVEMHPKKTPCKPQHQAGTDGEPVLPWYARMMPELSGTYAKVVRAIDFRATVRGWIDAALDKVSLQALKVSRRLEDAKARAVRAKEETTEAALERLRLVNERVRELQLELKEHAEAAKGYMVQKWKDNAVALGVGMVIMAMTTPLLAMAYSRARKNRLDKVAHQSYASDGVDGTAFKLEQRAVRYNRVEVDRAAFVPTSPTMSFEQLVSAVAANVVKIHVAETSTYVWGVVWTTGVVLTVKHAFFQPDHRYEMAFDVRSMDLPEKKTFELGVWAKGMIQPYVVRVSTRGSPQETVAGVRNRDLALFFCPGIISTTGNGVRDFTQKSSVRAVSSQFDQASLVTQVTERKAETAHFRPGYCTVSREPSIHVNIPTFNGDCGAPLVAQTGKWRALVGLHGAGFTDTEGRPGIGQAEEVVGIEIDAVKLDTYAAPVDGVAFQSELLRKGGGDIRFKALPEKSSLWAALGRMAAPVQVCGTLDPPLSLSSNKSRIYRTPMAQAFYDLEAKHAGPVPAFHAPEFGGKMVGEGPEAHWQDPYTLSLEAMRNVNGDPDAWTWAINDYLEGVENLPGWDRVRPLTDYEAWAGIPGAVKSTAMSTSAGAPFFQKKRDLVTVVPGQYVDVDPEIVSHVTAIEANLRANKVVVVPCWYTLKDEELSTKKKLAGKVRVFNTVGAAFNLVAKKYLAPLAMIVHANRDFFESAIGMDLTSDEVSQFVNALQRFGPDAIAAADFENYDLRTCTEASLKKAAVWRRLAEVAGYSKEDVQFVYVLALSCVYTMNVVKNDVFLCVFKMSSGILETGDGNGITNSLAHRYAWYRFWRSRGKEVPPFRSGVALRVLGDDNARGVAKWAREWTIAESAKAFREIGHTLTPASKEGDFQPYGDISTITFMKRAFVQRELRHSSGYTRVEWMAPLEKKSIVKQVVMGMNSELSRFDYHATLLSNAAREAFLHGEEFYDEYVRAACAAARDAKIEDNAKLVLMPYQFWADAYLEKRFRLWDPEENPNTSL